MTEPMDEDFLIPGFTVARPYEQEESNNPKVM
jgi:hypothetical protein